MIKFQKLRIYEMLKDPATRDKLLQAFSDSLCAKIQKRTIYEDKILGEDDLKNDLEIYLALAELNADGDEDAWDEEEK